MQELLRILQTGVFIGLKYCFVFIIGLGLVALLQTLLKPPGWVPSINAIIIVGGIGFIIGFFRGSIHHVLVMALKTEQQWLQKGAQIFLRNLGEPVDVFRILVAELKEPDPILRRSAARTLRKVPVSSVELGGALEFGKTPKVLTEAIDLLIASLEDKSVLKEAIETLKCITGKDFGEDEKQWEEWWKQNKK